MHRLAIICRHAAKDQRGKKKEQGGDDARDPRLPMADGSVDLIRSALVNNGERTLKWGKVKHLTELLLHPESPDKLTTLCFYSEMHRRRTEGISSAGGEGRPRLPVGVKGPLLFS